MSSFSSVIQRMKDSCEIDTYICDWIENVASTLNSVIISHEGRLSTLEDNFANSNSLLHSIEDRINDIEYYSTDNDVECDISYYYNETVKKLENLEKSVSVIFKESDSLQTKVSSLLRSSIIQNDISEVKHFLPCIRDIDCVSEDGQSFLEVSLQTKNYGITKYLLDQGAILQRNITSHITPQSKTFLMKEKALRRPKNFEEDIFIASITGNIESVRYLVQFCYCDIESKGDDGCTPLHYISEKSNLDVVKYLIEKGANINSKDDNGFTPLHYASGCGNLDFVKYLIAKGAIIDSKTDGGYTPLHRASYNGKLNVVKYLIDKGANAELKTNNGKTALQLARKEEVKSYLESICKKTE